MPIDFLFRTSSDHSPEVHWRKHYQTEKKIKGRVGLAAPGILRGTAGFHRVVFLFLNVGSARAELAFQEGQSNTDTKCLPRSHYSTLWFPKLRMSWFPESCAYLHYHGDKVRMLPITITPQVLVP